MPDRPPLPGVILRHSENGSPGRLGEWADARSIPYVVHHSWERAPDLDPADYRFVAALGSVHSVNDTGPAWIATELAFLRRAVDAGTPVLGLCWGAEALSAVLGGTVAAGPIAEKGWLEVASTDPGDPRGAVGSLPLRDLHHPRRRDRAGPDRRGPVGVPVRSPTSACSSIPRRPPELVDQWAAGDPEQTEDTRHALAVQGSRCGPVARPLAFALFDAWWARVSERSDG